MRQVTLEDAQTQLAALVEAALKGETVFIIGDNGQAVQLVPVPPTQRKPRVFDSAAGLITISDDFDEPLEDFAEYME